MKSIGIATDSHSGIRKRKFNILETFFKQDTNNEIV